jgi:hypothetical protein
MSRIRDFVRYIRSVRRIEEESVVDADTVETTEVTSTTVTSTNVTATDLTATALTASSIDLNGEVVEQVYTLTGTDLDPANGTIQLLTLTANTTLTSSIANGESVTLMIDDGTDYTITWPTMQWSGGEAPTLATSGYSVVTLWKAGDVLYGVAVGDMS